MSEAMMTLARCRMPLLLAALLLACGSDKKADSTSTDPTGETPTPETPVPEDPPTQPPGTLLESLQVVAGHSIYFAHQSVGEYIMDGVQTLLDQNSGSGVTVLDTSNSEDMGDGVFAHSHSGENTNPSSKISAFDATIRDGVGGAVDTAFLKFCWVDFYSGGAANGKSVDTIFGEYSTTLTGLQTAYPSVRFIHFTVPLEREQEDAGAANAVREAFSKKIRDTYGSSGSVFDLALFESTRANGTRCTNGSVPALCNEYASDAGHPSSDGEVLFATRLIELLATAP